MAKTTENLPTQMRVPGPTHGFDSPNDFPLEAVTTTVPPLTHGIWEVASSGTR